MPINTPTGGNESPLTIRLRQTGGTERVYDFASLSCPDLRGGLAAAFGARIAPATGPVRSLATADLYYAAVRRFTGFLDALGEPLDSLAAVRPRHLHQYRASLGAKGTATSVARELGLLFRLLLGVPYGSLAPDLRDLLHNPGGFIGPVPRYGGPVTYSRDEYTALLQAAREDAEEIRDRIAASEKLLDAFRCDPGVLSDSDRATGAVLDEMDRTGRPPADRLDRLGTARRLFLTTSDLAPLLVLASALTGLRAKTLHALPTGHESVGGAVVLRVPGDREPGHGLVRWPTSTGTGRPLHEAGDFYLLLHQLTARSRRFSRSNTLWSVWTPAGHTRLAPRAVPGLMGDWVRTHRLTADDGQPLDVLLNRLRATVHARHRA
ncbi:hypothetical protein [Streptomyces sp. NPDC058045]|uniref:hypothetical protein n=1 Tax=Streptomyces sp. NPDC058045 TaxID=3346311 RepID=UPI0036E6DACA